MTTTRYAIELRRVRGSYATEQQIPSSQQPVHLKMDQLGRNM
jgi:hypothetical protein